MSIQNFHDSSDQLIDVIEAFVKSSIEQTGNAAYECQQTQILNDLLAVSHGFNGTEADDLSNPKDSHETFFVAMTREQIEAVTEAVNVATMRTKAMTDESALHAQAATTSMTDALVR